MDNSADLPMAVAWFGFFFSLSEFARLAARCKVADQILTFGAEHQRLDLSSADALLGTAQNHRSLAHKTMSTTSTPQQPFKRLHIPTNRDHKALNRGTLEGLGMTASPGRIQKGGPTSGQGYSYGLDYTYTPRCTSIKGLMISIGWYLGFLNGRLGGAGRRTLRWIYFSAQGSRKVADCWAAARGTSLEGPTTQIQRHSVPSTIPAAGILCRDL